MDDLTAKSLARSFERIALALEVLAGVEKARFYQANPPPSPLTNTVEDVS